MVLEGIDVSHHNPLTMDLSGLSFVFSKTTQGLGFVDPEYQAHVAMTKSAGKLPGSYHFLEETNGAQQCDIWLAQTRLAAGPQHLYAVDVERYGPNESLHPVAADLVAFHQRFHQVMPRRKLFVYSYRSFWLETFGSYQHKCPDCLLWSSSIQQQWPTAFGGFGVVTLHQYDTKTTDRDRFAGTLAQLQSLGSLPPVPAKPAPHPVPVGDSPLLSLGMRGQQVADVQHALDLLGNQTAKVDGKGIFGHETQRVLRVFQQHTPRPGYPHKLPVTGTVTPTTWAALRVVAHPTQ